MANNNYSNSYRKQNKAGNNQKATPGKYVPKPEDPPRNFKVVKPIWAAYINMARQNIYQTLCHISHVLGYEIDKDDKQLEENLLQIPAVNLLNKKGKAEEIGKAMKMIDRHFPFVSPMVEKLIELNNKEIRKYNDAAPKSSKKPEIKEKTPALYYEVFQDILPLINLLRNYYSHHDYFDPRIDAETGRITDEKLCKRCAKLAVMLDYCTTGARRIVKERFSVGDKATFTAADFDLFEGLRRYYDFLITDENGKQKKVKRELRCYIYRIGDKDNNEELVRLTNMGIYLLICLFLNKKYAKEFGDKTDFWGKNCKAGLRPTDKEMAIMHETSCVYRIRLPKERLQSEKDKSAVGLDMLNELKKCPNELFDTLSAGDRDRFRVNVNAGTDGSDDSTVLMLRSFDRFPTLALQYLDTMEMFGRIRFQVQLGNYRYKFYNKNWIDSADDNDGERVRILQKELMGYGRLGEIEAQRKARWGSLIRLIDKPRADTADTKPYITDHHASYHISNNHIGLQWNSPDEVVLDKKGIFMPSTTLPDWVSGSAPKAEDAAPVAECHAPKCWLSVYDLPAVCFLTHLTGSGERAERIIIETTERYKAFFKAIGDGEIIPYDKETKVSFIPQDKKESIIEARKAGKPYSYIIEPYGIDFAALPRKVQDYLLGDSSRSNGDAQFKTQALATLNNELERTKSRLKRFREELALYAGKDNKLGKKSHVDIRQGSLARFLAKDMVHFKEPDEDGKVVLTSQNFNILQAELAVYRKNRREWADFFRRADLIGGKRPHPFLQKVLDRGPRDFHDFYTKYLEERCKQLEAWIRAGKNELPSLHFLHPSRAKWQNRNKAYYRELAKRYSSIELPGNLFLDAIVEALKETEPAKSGNPVLLNALACERKNAAYLINAYMQASGSGYQPFYGYRRCYKYFSMTYNPQWNINAPIPKLVDQYLTVGQMEQYIKDTDKDAREDAYVGSLSARKDALAEKARRRYKYDDRKARALKLQFNEDAAAAADKLSRSYKFYTDNERTIRLRKVQDAVLFLMAKDVLTHTMADADFSAYRLRDIGMNGDKDILSKQLPFAVRLQIPVIENGVEAVREITIWQDDLKLKNYGDFFRFVYDSRILPLLAQVEAEEIDRAALEKELDNYDQNRIPLFEHVHELEARVCRTLDSAQLHPVNENGKSINVDFKYLMQFVNIKESNIQLLRDIRNAFCHSTYPEGEKVDVVFTQSGKQRSIPTIAHTLVDDFSRRAKAATPKQKPIK